MPSKKKKKTTSPKAPRRFGDEFDLEIRKPGIGKTTLSFGLFISTEAAKATYGAGYPKKMEELLASSHLKICFFVDPIIPRKPDVNEQQTIEGVEEIWLLVQGDVNGFTRNEAGYSFSLKMHKTAVELKELSDFAFHPGRAYITQKKKVVADEHAGDPDPE